MSVLWFVLMIIGAFVMSFIGKVAAAIGLGAAINRDWLAACVFGGLALIGACSTIFLVVSIAIEGLKLL